MTEAKKPASPLSRKATLVSVEISQWTARKYDKKITEEVNTSHGAVSDAGRYNKLLLEKKRLARINSLVTQARELHYKFTKPWCDAGLRILPNKLHQEFAAAFRKIKLEFDEAADEFEVEFPAYVAERRKALNGMFDEADYPAPSEIRSKFKLATKTLPIPEADDFRSDVLDEQTIADIKAEIAATNDEVMNGATADTVAKITDVVKHMAEKLKTYKQGENFFKDSLVNNVRELVELLPAFNFMNDPKLDAVITRMRKELCSEEPKALREHDDIRATVAKSADEILADVEALLG